MFELTPQIYFFMYVWPWGSNDNHMHFISINFVTCEAMFALYADYTMMGHHVAMHSKTP